MTSYSDLSQRISVCSDAIRFVRGKDEHASSYQEVIKLLPPVESTKHRNINLIKASLAYLKKSIDDGDNAGRKVNIALYVAIYIGYDDEKDGLANEFCKRFQGLENYDVKVMMKIFSLSLCTGRTVVLLDNAMLRKKRNIKADIDHELRVEFILLYMYVLKSLVRRGEPLTDLGYLAGVTVANMEAAWLISGEHVSSIADKFWPCFDIEVLKKPRVKNNLFPSDGKLPRVVIGREHIDFDQATTDTLKGALLDRPEKDEFLQVMCAIVSLAACGPVKTYLALELEPVKAFFMDTILDKTQVDQVLEAVPEIANTTFFIRKLGEYKAKVSALTRKVSSMEETEESARQKFLASLKSNSSQQEELEENERELKRLRESVYMYKYDQSFCKQYHVMKKVKRSPGRMDKYSLMNQR